MCRRVRTACVPWVDRFYSAVGLAISCLLRSLAPHGSLVREVAGWSCLGHGFIFGGSLAPLPIVDGGSMLKWTLVERGRTPEQADEIVAQVDLSLGTALAATGIAVAATRRNRSARHEESAARRWLPALGLIAAGAIAIVAARGKGPIERQPRFQPATPYRNGA